LNILRITILLIIALGAAWGLAFALTEAARRAALRWGVVSPVTSRSSHRVPTPRLGGLGLALGFGLAAFFFLAALRLFVDRTAFFAGGPHLLTWAALGWLMMLIVGLLDDLFDLPALLKLALQVLATLAPAWGGGILFALHPALGPQGPALTLFCIALTMFWLLFFTNGYNFMDGMDGFAAGFARSSALFMFGLMLVAGGREGTLHDLRAGALLLPILAAACGGFLRLNRPPARVFMGDAGSLSVGYLLALAVVLGRRGDFGVRLPLLSSLTVLLPFVFDVLLTIARRARLGQNLLKAHREHLYQRLMRSGLSHGEVLRINHLCFGLCGLAGLLGAASGAAAGRWAGLALALAVMGGYWRLTLRREAFGQQA
jgi:UDP-N-acetylmuramyl pentapeptide phosphotransferase/UDP-N-acetylglucosamine-1-phosphate transferase